MYKPKLTLRRGGESSVGFGNILIVGFAQKEAFGI